MSSDCSLIPTTRFLCRRNHRVPCRRRATSCHSHRASRPDPRSVDRDQTAAGQRSAEGTRPVRGRAGVDDVTCWISATGARPRSHSPSSPRRCTQAIEQFRPDVIVTFGPDGGTGHPDHVTSCLATIEAHPRHARSAAVAPRELPDGRAGHRRRDRRVADRAPRAIRRHVRVRTRRSKLFTDGTSMLGVSADHLHVDWFPAGSFIVEQGEPACELFCILSGSVVVVVEQDDGQMSERGSFSAGCFFGEDGLATGLPRNVHVIARDDVTCLVLAPTQQNDRVAGRGPRAVVERSAYFHGVDGPRRRRRRLFHRRDACARSQGGSARGTPVAVRDGTRSAPAVAARTIARNRALRGRVRRERLTRGAWRPRST